MHDELEVDPKYQRVSRIELLEKKIELILDYLKVEIKDE